LFCQGCVSEFSTSPEQVYEAIRYFGSRKKIFWVHFRNIRGGFLKFEETFPDEGDIDMLRAMRIYKEVGYDGVLIPDHVPKSALDSRWGHRAHAFCLGYIKALIQTVESGN
jgi:mannonate dehydratase